MKDPEDISLITTPERLTDIAMAFQRSRIFLTAYELDIFTAMGDDALTSGEIAAKTGVNEHACDRLLNALCALGLAVKDEGIFSNTEFTRRFLVQGSEEYLAGFGHAANLYRSWGTLTGAVRAGTSTAGQQGDERDSSSLESFIAAMHRRAAGSAGGLIAKIDLKGVSRVLDVGGGSGVYAMAFARAKNDLRAVVFDLPGVRALTERYTGEAGLSDRVSTRSGNYLTDDFGDGFDLVFLSAVVHINSFDENELLIRKSFNALNTGGRVVVQDFVMDEERITPVMGAVFALNMLVNTACGDTYTESEIRSWLSSAGCTGIRRIESGPATAMMIGSKP